MTKYFTLFLLLSAVSFGNAQDRTLKAFLDTKQFYTPETGHYTEFQYQFLGYSLNYSGKDNGLIADVAVQLNITSETGEVIVNDLYRLQSPLMIDSIVEDFYDIRRYAIPPGKYSFSVNIFDVNSEKEPLSSTAKLTVNNLEDQVSHSNFLLVEYAVKGSPESIFYKSGYEIIPRMSNYFPEDLSYLPFYLELYNTPQIGEAIEITQSIINKETLTEVSGFSSTKRLKSEAVLPVMRNIDLASLPTGQYAVALVIKDTSGKEYTTAMLDFDRQNTIEVMNAPENVILDPAFEASIPLDSSLYYMASLLPIAKAETQRSIRKQSKVYTQEEAVKFIQSFWTTTSGNNAYEEWMRYKMEVKKVQNLFGNNFMEGFETDRGRVYLQYGSPSSRFVKEYSPSEYPYEIWQYNKIGRFSNKRFVFYNRDLVNKNYVLLHSDMIGEIKNPNWQYVLNQRNTDPNGDVQESFGGNSGIFYRQN